MCILCGLWTRARILHLAKELELSFCILYVFLNIVSGSDVVRV
jgi:hypothetical protein